MLIYFTIMLVYLVVGAVYSRQRYANLCFEAKADAIDFKKIEKSKAALNEDQRRLVEMRGTNYHNLAKYHNAGCDKLIYTHIGNCNCGAVKNTVARIKANEDFLEGKIEEPGVFRPALGWPLFMAGNFMRSGQPSNSEAFKRIKEIEQAKHDAEIAELRARESKALDEQLALSRKELN